MDLRRIARFDEGTEADAWVVGAGSRELLEWFNGRMTPTFALFGLQEFAFCGRPLKEPLGRTGLPVVAFLAFVASAK